MLGTIAAAAGGMDLTGGNYQTVWVVALIAITFLPKRAEN